MAETFDDLNTPIRWWSGMIAGGGYKYEVSREAIEDTLTQLSRLSAMAREIEEAKRTLVDLGIHDGSAMQVRFGIHALERRWIKNRDTALQSLRSDNERLAGMVPRWIPIGEAALFDGYYWVLLYPPSATPVQLRYTEGGWASGSIIVPQKKITHVCACEPPAAIHLLSDTHRVGKVTTETGAPCKCSFENYDVCSTFQNVPNSLTEWCGNCGHDRACHQSPSERV